ncbi:hypothetical protein RIF29_09292 [Crotalaria pallida]|uniref:Uncharacterized protein n=1 Tax=Crotalaria pallida TaxID=3830 RepID=A0AAN9IHT7_CROPI
MDEDEWKKKPARGALKNSPCVTALEDELSQSISSCRVEADVVKTWINFLEDTWLLQLSNAETNEKRVNDELEKHEDYFVNLAIRLLSLLHTRLETASSVDSELSKVLNPRRNLEEEYLTYEAKIITTFSVVDNMKQQFLRSTGEDF